MINYFINKKDGMKMSCIPSQSYKMGSSSNVGHPIDREGPPETVEINSFYISETTISNEQFGKFIEETGYITDAEKIGSSFVFSGLIEDDIKEETNYSNTPIPWWLDVSGASWKYPEGPTSTIENRMDHPVVHVSWNDAVSYCNWSGGRLPTEAEWEVAASGNGENTEYPWGNQLVAKGIYHANTWQGKFPSKNTEKDGYFGTAPVDKFYKNEYELYQMIGNVWEWCLNPARIPLKEFNKQSSTDFLEKNNKHRAESYAIRGGSFLCHHSYCNRYRLAARNGNTRFSSASNMGFRYVVDVN